MSEWSVLPKLTRDALMRQRRHRSCQYARKAHVGRVYLVEYGPYLYRGRVTHVENARAHVHYTGWSTDHDEWVELPRLFLCTKAGKAAATYAIKHPWTPGPDTETRETRVGQAYQAEIPPWRPTGSEDRSVSE